MLGVLYLSRAVYLASAPPSVALAGATVAVVLDVDADGVLDIATEFLRLFLGKGISGNDWGAISTSIPEGSAASICHTFKRLVNVDGFFGTRLEVRNVAFGLAEGHSPLVRDLHQLAYGLS